MAVAASGANQFVDDEEERVAATCDASINRALLPTVGGLHVVDIDPILGDPPGDEFLGAVGGAVVDDHPHEVVGGLRHEALVEWRFRRCW